MDVEMTESVDAPAKQDGEKRSGTAKTEEGSPLDKIFPDYMIAEWRHGIILPDELSPEKETLKKKLMERITKNDMLPFYRDLCNDLSWALDEELVKRMEANNAKELEKLEAAVEDAKENYGDTEVRDAILSKAHFYCRIGDKKTCTTLYTEAYDKSVGTGGRIDILLTLIRIGFFYHDPKMSKKYIHIAKEEIEKGGDWERRNKLKVYEAVILMMCRGFKEAAELLLGATATFTATELLSFDSFVFYAVIMSMLTLDRAVLREKVTSSPEVIQVTATDEHLGGLLNSYYQCNYRVFMTHLVHISTRVKSDRYLSRHYLYFIRNIRLKAYSQFLEPYKSVTLENMATAFGVSEEFIEDEVSSFIASGRLTCKIDMINRVIESNRPDSRNRLYHHIIKQGDMLLNRIQKLSRVIDI